MAGKNKKFSSNPFKSSREKRLKEMAKAVSNDDTPKEKSSVRQGLKGNPKKSLKKAIQQGSYSDAKSKQTPYQNVITGTPKKALKGIINEGLRKNDEAQKALNKQYRIERDRLRRRVEYFKSKGYTFSDDIIPPVLDGNATKEEIDFLKAIRGAVLRKMATSFTPSGSEAIEEIEQEIVPINDEIEAVEEATDLAEEGEIDDDWEFSEEERQRAKDALHGFEQNHQQEPEESPQERYYRENPERKADYDAKVDEGRIILENVYADLDVNQRVFLESRLRDDSFELQVKQDAAVRLANAISTAISTFGEEAVCLKIEANAEAFKRAVNRALYFFDSKDETRTYFETEDALTEVQGILFAETPGLLMEMAFGK